MGAFIARFCAGAQPDLPRSSEGNLGKRNQDADGYQQHKGQKARKKQYQEKTLAKRKTGLFY
ncbi:hypothetical protein AA0481_0122 [Acetobacter orientalis NRIC 0481]|uniref:Uncharacterized protein n=1 Tax=Acetobacter orientalis TaxID=146474 RepID=A0A0D6NNU7_9PROT|nr:hypothetical protein Abor_065_077 [Acetobacter orientalis]GBR12646.1 hypothetical protein AA0481_0122 [Acetobacter orientalis NRIC 0481]GEL62370.1 hypothetical protein AOR02nite_22120 [Acetobacter orientalis]